MIDMELLKEQNPWWAATGNIEKDVSLEKLKHVPYAWHPKVVDSFDMEKDVIYTLRGSRQIGKTTTLKLLIRKLLAENRKENILYFTCNNIDTYQELIDILRLYLDWADNDQRKYVFIDEITFVKNWTRAIKHFADLGLLRNTAMILTGSNAHDLKYEIERMPGRRGQDPDLDKILFPVSFGEYLGFVAADILRAFPEISSAKKNYPFYKKELKKHLDHFLLTGGFIRAINGFSADGGTIGIDIYHQYLSWILGDLSKMGRKESYSRQIFEQILKNMTANIGFDTIAQKTSIRSHLTVEDYLDVMESNFIVKILYQADVNKKIAAARKTKKIYFQDLFLLWVFEGYVRGLPDYFLSAKTRLGDALMKSRIIENLVMASLMPLETSVNWSNIIFFFRTANQAEVDFVVKRDRGELLPIEVKYQNEVGPGDFLHLDKVNKQKGIIISKEDFRIEKNKWILPVEIFLLLKEKCLNMDY